MAGLYKLNNYKDGLRHAQVFKNLVELDMHREPKIGMQG